MKAKRSSKAKSVVLELGPHEAQLPATTLPEVNLRRILVPVDFSESSRKALHYAIFFAKQFNAELVLLHSIELPPPPPETVLTTGDLVNADAQKAAAKKRLLEWSKQAGVRTDLRATVSFGNPHFQIVEEAKSSNVDLIVMGTHGRTGFSHLLIGSTAERVVRHAPCPVMVIREREHDFVETKERTTFAGNRAEAS